MACGVGEGGAEELVGEGGGPGLEGEEPGGHHGHGFEFDAVVLAVEVLQVGD